MGEPMKADRVALIRERLRAGLPVDPGDVIALCDSHEDLRLWQQLADVVLTAAGVAVRITDDPRG